MDKLTKLLESTESDNTLFSTLSETYEQLKLKNVPMSDDMQVKLEKKLLGHHFLINKTNHASPDKFKSFEHIKVHLDFTCTIIDQFLLKYLEKEFEVDLEFMFWTKYIAQNISVLKRRIDYTYETLPWEEIQFCLVIYLHSLSKSAETNIVYKLILDKNRVLNHLLYFYGKLKEVKENLKEENLLLKKPINRNIIKNKILKESPSFKSLYEDFAVLRNVFSLIRIQSYLEQALSVDITENSLVGQLVIERTLQVIGECLKNSVDSPNLSDNLYKFLIKVAPRNLRGILSNVRNMMSHAFSLNRKLELEISKDINFFKNVQLDLNKVHIEIVHMFYHQKINAVNMFLLKILNQHNLDDIERIFKETNIEEIKITTEYHHDFDDFANVRELIHLFCQQVLEESTEDTSLIEEVKNITESYKTKINVLFSKFLEAVDNLIRLQGNKKELTTVHSMARTYLTTIASSEPQSIFDEIFKKLYKIYENFKRRKNYENNFIESDDKFNKLTNTIIEIYNSLKWGLRRIRWIEEIENKLTLKVNVDEEKIQKISCIFAAIENKLEEGEEKNCLHDIVAQKIRIHLGKAEIINNFDKDPETFECIVKSLRLSTKREKEILHNFETKKYKRLQLQLKEINDDYGTLIKQLGDIFPLNKYTNSLKTFYNNLKLKKPLQIKILNAISDVVQEEVTDAYSKRLQILKNIMKNTDFLNIQENTFLRTAIEMLVLDLVEYLENVKLLGDNKLFLVESLPLLKGKQLRNYLAHGDILIDILPYNPLISITLYAEKLVDLNEAILSQNDILIGCKVSCKTIGFNEYFEKCLSSIKYQKMLYDYIKNNDSCNVAKILNNGAEIEGISLDGRTVVDFAIYAGSLELFQFFLTNSKKFSENIYYWLKTAVISGQFNIMEYIINTFKVDINYKYQNNMTLLHFALKYGHPHIVKLLVETKVTKNWNDKTTLLTALESGMRELVILSLDNCTESLNAFIGDNATALHVAVKNNFQEAVKLLQEKDTNPFLQIKNGPTAIEVTAQYGYKNILKIFLETPTLTFSSEVVTRAAFLAAESGHLNTLWPLLENYVNINNPGRETLLHRSAFFGHQEDVKTLIMYGADSNSSDENGCKALHLACQCGHTQVIDLLLENGADINAEDNEKWSPLHWATQHNQENIVKLLLSKNANGRIFNKNGKIALHLAAENCYVEIFIILLKHIGDANITTENRRTALHIAAENGHDTIVTILITISNIEINATTENDETPLILAASNGHYNVVEQLLKHGARVNNKSKKEGYTALTRAAEQGYADIVTILIKNHAGIEHQEVTKWRALHFVVQNGYTDILEILLKNKVDVNSKYDNGGSALHTAAKNGHVDIVQKLILYGADVNAMVMSLLPLRIAANFGHQDIVLMLLKNGANINATGSDCVAPLHSATAKGHKEIVDLLLKNGADVNSKTEDKCTALHLAAKSGYYDIVMLLLETGTDINYKNNNGATAFHAACEMGHTNIATILLERSNAIVDIKNIDGWTALHFASANGHIPIIELLIKYKCNVNIKANDGSTPLHWAISTEVVEFLVKNKAKVNVKDSKGSTPLHLATLNGYKNVVKILLQNKVDVNARNGTVSFLSPLHLAAAFGHFEIIKMLLENGADINAQGSHGETGLHLAAAGGYINIVHSLLANGAEVNITDASDVTPIYLAVEKGSQDIVELLIKNGAAVNTSSNSGYTPLYSAIAQDHENIAVLLITNNADIDTKIHREPTILQLAIKKGMKNVVSALIHRGVNLNIGINTVTPLMESLLLEHEDIAVLLIQNNANINTVNSNEWTPLHLAAGKGYKKVVDILLRHQVDINAKTSNWETPLYFASMQGHLEIVARLLENNANVNVQTQPNGWTAVMIAAQKQHTQIIELLIKHNADVNLKGEHDLTPLHLSTLHGDGQSIQMFLKHNADTKIKTDKHWTALHLAALKGHASIVEMLLENNVDNLNEEADEKATPLFLAVEYGHKRVVEMLLKYKANTQIKGKNDLTPIELATQKGFTDIVEILSQETEYLGIRNKI